MAPRNTNTGGVLESMVLPALARGGYVATTQVHVGTRLGKQGRHKVDAVAIKDGVGILVSSKWQQSSGTAEEKVPYEVMCLAAAISDPTNTFSRGYVVLGGTGWSLRDFYTNGGLKQYLQNVDGVQVVTLEQFVVLANKGEL